MAHRKPVAERGRRPVYFGITLSGLNAGKGVSFASFAKTALKLRDETGFNAAEIWMDGGGHPSAFWPEQYDNGLTKKVKAFLSHFDFFGVHLPFSCSDFTSINPAVARTATEQILLAIRISGRLGARYLVGHARFGFHGRFDTEEGIRRYAEEARSFCDLAARYGMIYCMETCEYLDAPWKMARIAEEVDHPAFRLTLDAGKMMVYASRKFRDPRAKDYLDGTPKMLAWLRQHGRLIGSTHLWDYEISPGKGDRILPGNGLCDVKAVVRALAKCGYEGSYNLETSGTYREEKTAINTLKGYIDEALSGSRR